MFLRTCKSLKIIIATKTFLLHDIYEIYNCPKGILKKKLETHRSLLKTHISHLYFLPVWKRVQIGVQVPILVITYTICDSAPTPVFIANHTINCFL